MLEAVRPHGTPSDGGVRLRWRRDRGRPEMGAIAARLADGVVVTDDNPRKEDPGAIRKEISATCSGCVEVAGRYDAIRIAVSGLAEGDILVVAGKGHETGQIIGDETIPFSMPKWARMREGGPMSIGRKTGGVAVLFNLLVPLADEYIVFNLFRYLTFRTGGAIMTALLVSFIFGPAVINWLKNAQKETTRARRRPRRTPRRLVRRLWAVFSSCWRFQSAPYFGRTWNGYVDRRWSRSDSA